MTYAQSRKDFEYLESVHELEDQVDLDAERENLMRNPNKETARLMYLSAICLWFSQNNTLYHIKWTPHIRQISERYGYGYD